MRVIIAGSRGITDPSLVWDAIQSAPFFAQMTEVVHGGAKGVDQLASVLTSVKWPEKVFQPDWNTHGRAAGPIRNRQMAEYADALVAVWDGVSRGTANMIAEMRKLGKPVHVVVVSAGEVGDD